MSTSNKDTPILTRAEITAKREARIKALENLRIYGYPGSKVDPRYPEEGNATTQSVRENFGHTKYELEQAQAAIQTLGNQINAIDSEFVSKLGDQMKGPLTLDPNVPISADNEFVTKGYVDGLGVGGGGGGGLPEAPQDSKIYGRKDATWVEVPSGGGGTSGPVEWVDIQNKPQEIEALDGTVNDSLVSGGTF